MQDKIGGYFGLEGAENISLLDAKDHTRLAVAVILLESARSDEQLADSEREIIKKQLEHRFGLSAAEAAALEAKAESPESRALVERSAQTLANDLTVAQREFILTLAWSVISADRSVVERESQFAVRLRQLLGLSLEQSLRARKAAEGLTIDGFKELVEASTAMHDGIKDQLLKLHGKRGA